MPIFHFLCVDRNQRMPMNSSSSADTNHDSSINTINVNVLQRLSSIPSIFALAVSCGLIAGLLEVAVIVARKRLFEADQILKLSHHFIWLIPVANLCVFLALAVIGSAVVVAWPRRGRRLITRTFAAFTILPALLVAFPKIYSISQVFVAGGVAAWIVPFLGAKRLSHRFHFAAGFLLPLCILGTLAGSVWYRDHSRQTIEDARPLPQTGSPNVLLLVLDTVASSHSSFNGYNRATTNTLQELAGRGIRFDCARATSSWTLPSHASMFTGCWLHELKLGWLTPLDGREPTIAEFLGDRGYATAGFIANRWYCSSDSGLARGFTHYEDHMFPYLTALKTCVIVGRAIESFQEFTEASEDYIRSARFHDGLEFIRTLFVNNRKDAAEVNRELLDWLSTRKQQGRPFFAFLNYFDAHYPYVLKPGRLRRFGTDPDDAYKRLLINHWWEIDKTKVSPSGVAYASDAYDDCIADLDEQVGILIDTLERRGVLKDTWLIVVSDHGESFGEHPDVFGHGGTLFDTEVRVPMLIIPPSGTVAKTGLTVRDPVTIRDIAATIADMAGLASAAPFPGESLLRFSKDGSAESDVDRPAILSELVPNDPTNRNYWGLPVAHPPRASLKDTEWSYMRREVEIGEQLYHLTEDPREQRNLAQDPSTQGLLHQLRERLNGRTNGPLLPGRFFP